MIMRKPPSDHDEWLEENKEPEKASELPQKQVTNAPLPTKLRGAKARFKALNDDIQEFG